MTDLTKLTLTETLNGLKEKEFTEKELNEVYLESVKSLNPKLNAFLTVLEGDVGIPAAIKDIIMTKGIKTTAGSKILENFLPPYNATIIERLQNAGVRILGKTNCDEFAMGSSGENSAYGPTQNPWDPGRIPGGSSSGSAVAVAADMCVFALGTDTGGSIRQPASLCGVVGLKPSYGRVSRYGVIAMASSLDCPGPITKSVEDARLVLGWISGKDGKDSNCSEESFKNQGPRIKDNLKGVKVGIPKEFFGKGLDQNVEKSVKEAIKKMEDLGATIVDVSLPHSEYAIAAYYIIMASEVSSNMGRYDGIRYGGSRDQFGAEVKRRVMLGTFSLSAGYFDDYFAKAARVRTLIKQDFEKVFQSCDVILGPVSPTVAWKLGEKVDNPLAMYLSDIYTVPVSLAGLPALSVPCGFAQNPSTHSINTQAFGSEAQVFDSEVAQTRGARRGRTELAERTASSGQVLPVGLQIIGKYLNEETILNVGEIYQANTNWHKKKSNI